MLGEDSPPAREPDDLTEDPEMLAAITLLLGRGRHRDDDCD
jgi:hypothetical protein